TGKAAWRSPKRSRKLGNYSQNRSSYKTLAKLLIRRSITRPQQEIRERRKVTYCADYSWPVRRANKPPIDDAAKSGLKDGMSNSTQIAARSSNWRTPRA